MLKRTPSLTEQAKNHIKESILNDEYEDGKIPSETDLAAELGVSRATVRDALGRLELEGAIIRKQGAGTFVNQPVLQIRSRLEEMWSYEAVLEAHGYTPSVQVLAVHTTTADAPTAAALHIQPGDALVVIEKLFLEDDEPVILTLNRVVGRLVHGRVSPEACRVPMFEFLAEQCRCQLSYYVSEIVPVLTGRTAPASVATRLHVPPHSPLISFEEIGYSDEAQPLVQATSYFRDELLRLRLVRKPG